MRTTINTQFPGIVVPLESVRVKVRGGFFFIFRIYFVVRLRRLCTYNVLNCTYGRPLRKIHERGPRCPEVRPRPPPMNEDGRRTAPMTMRDEPASEPAEAGGLGKLNGGE